MALIGIFRILLEYVAKPSVCILSSVQICRPVYCRFREGQKLSNLGQTYDYVELQVLNLVEYDLNCLQLQDGASYLAIRPSCT